MWGTLLMPTVLCLWLYCIGLKSWFITKTLRRLFFIRSLFFINSSKDKGFKNFWFSSLSSWCHPVSGSLNSRIRWLTPEALECFQSLQIASSLKHCFQTLITPVACYGHGQHHTLIKLVAWSQWEFQDGPLVACNSGTKMVCVKL